MLAKGGDSSLLGRGKDLRLVRCGDLVSSSERRERRTFPSPSASPVSCTSELGTPMRETAASDAPWRTREPKRRKRAAEQPARDVKLSERARWGSPQDLRRSNAAQPRGSTKRAEPSPRSARTRKSKSARVSVEDERTSSSRMRSPARNCSALTLALALALLLRRLDLRPTSARAKREERDNVPC